jgi:hypothetical protein
MLQSLIGGMSNHWIFISTRSQQGFFGIFTPDLSDCPDGLDFDVTVWIAKGMNESINRTRIFYYSKSKRST